MLRIFRLFLSLLLLTSAFLLAGCESREEKAERYFKSGSGHAFWHKRFC